MNLYKLLIFKDSRKAGFGLWVFIAANIYLVKHLITSDQWFTALALSSALIGGGTIADKMLENQKHKLQNITDKQNNDSATPS